MAPLMSDSIRLAHRVAELVPCSRAEAEQYVQNGWVLVDGLVVEAPQHLVSDERVELGPDAQLTPIEPATILLHKPVGFDSIRGPNPAANLVTEQSRWASDPSGVRLLQRHFKRLVPLVALEVEASGLMVLTQDNSISRRLIDQANQIEHEYLVQISGEIEPGGLHRISHGITSLGRLFPPCKISWQNETHLRVAIKGVREGQLRDVCAQVGLEVVSIRCLRIGRIPLGKGPKGSMPPGQWRYLASRDRF